TARLRAESVVQRVASLSRGSVARYAGSFASAFDNLWFRGLRPCHHRLRSCGPLCGQAKRALASCVETYGQGWGLTVVSLLRRRRPTSSEHFDLHLVGAEGPVEQRLAGFGLMYNVEPGANVFGGNEN